MTGWAVVDAVSARGRRRTILDEPARGVGEASACAWLAAHPADVEELRLSEERSAAARGAALTMVREAGRATAAS